MLHPQRNNVVEFKPHPEVRFGEPVDEKQISLLLLLAHAENSIFKFDMAKVVYVMRRLLYTPFLPPQDTGLRGCFGVIGPKGGTLEALTMVAASQQWYSNDGYLEEYLVYVHPEYRIKGHAAKLIDFLIALSEQMKIPLLTGVLSQTRMEAKCRLYRRKMMPIGQFFLHMPKGAEQWESARTLQGLTKSSSAAA